MDQTSGLVDNSQEGENTKKSSRRGKGKKKNSQEEEAASAEVSFLRNGKRYNKGRSRYITE